MYLANGTETTVKADAVQAVYYITVNKMISSDSASSITVVKSTTNADITVDLPKDVQQSGAPLDGNIRIKCINA